MRHVLCTPDALEQGGCRVLVVRVGELHKSIVLQHDVVAILAVRPGHLLACRTLTTALDTGKGNLCCGKRYRPIAGYSNLRQCRIEAGGHQIHDVKIALSNTNARMYAYMTGEYFPRQR